MAKSFPVVVAKGDGIGPEIMDATLFILKEAGCSLDYQFIDVGEKVYLAGNKAGIDPKAWDLLREIRVFLKAPITTPQGGGYKSLNVTARKTLGLYANVRPAISYVPFVESKYPGMDLVIVRENEEGMYVGIEHQQTPDLIQSLKIITRPACEKICTYAFEYARRYGRKKVTCFIKDNIMKMTDGLFHQVFDQVAKQYSDIQNESYIVDIGMAKMADTPEAFDVIVMPNLYGDIASDITAQIAGSVGLAGSANIGDHCAMFEAIHGSAPRRAGQGVANPSGLLNGAIMMLVHLGLTEQASAVQNAWLRTLEDGVHTYDIAKEGAKSVGTMDFAKAIVSRLGQKPQQLRAVDYSKAPKSSIKPYEYKPTTMSRDLVGVDVGIYNKPHMKPHEIGDALAKVSENFELKSVSSRGVSVWPNKSEGVFVVDRFLCRFMAKSGKCSHEDIRSLLARIEKSPLEWVRMEGLYNLDGKPGFSA